MTLLLKTRIDWSRQCALQWPTLQAAGQCGFRYAEALRPLGQAHRDAVEGDPVRAGSVAILFTQRGPFAVLWCVAKSAIDSLQRHASWARTYVAEKRLEVLPAITDRNPATTVKVEHRIIWIATAAQHALPAFVFGGAAIGRMTVWSAYTSATARISGRETSATDERVVAARAATKPYDTVAIALRRWLNRGQFTEDVTSKIACGSLLGSHAVASCSGDGVVRGWRAVKTLVGLANFTTVAA